MARLFVQLAALCRPDQARGDVLLRPLAGLMRPDDEASPAGPGWYESSLDLRRGLMVREWGPQDRLPSGPSGPSGPVTEADAPRLAIRYPGGLDFVV